MIFPWFHIVILLVAIGAVAHAGTILHTISLAIDMLVQGIIWNAPIGVTISSRAGLAARNGRKLGATIINLLALNQQHCEQAITGDIARARAALNLLEGGKHEPP